MRHQLTSTVQHRSLRLFCFHHAGGSGSSYRSWGPLFPADWDLRFIEYPGHGASADRPPQRNIGAIVDAVLPSIVPLLDRPSAFFGHSMGSLVALELARRVRELGLSSPFWIGASGRGAPQRRPRCRFFLHKLSDDALIDVVGKMGALPRVLLSDARESARFVELLRADFEACETYHPARDPQLLLPISAYFGTADPTVSFDEVRAWSELTTDAFQAHAFAGGHFFLSERRRDVVRQIITDVREALLAATSVRWLSGKTIPSKSA